MPGANAPRPSAVGTRIEAPKAPKGWNVKKGVPSHRGRGLPENVSIFEVKKAIFGAFWD